MVVLSAVAGFKAMLEADDARVVGQIGRATAARTAPEAAESPDLSRVLAIRFKPRGSDSVRSRRSGLRSPIDEHLPFEVLSGPVPMRVVMWARGLSLIFRG